MATLTMSAGGGMVNPEGPKPGEPGSYSADGHTCLHLMRNDKKKEKLLSADAGWILLHHFLFSLAVLGMRNGSGCRTHRAPTALPAATEERRQGRGRGRWPGPPATPRRGSGEGQRVPYPGAGLHAVPRVWMSWAHSVQKHTETSRAQQSPEEQIAQEVMVRKQRFFKVFSVCHK